MSGAIICKFNKTNFLFIILLALFKDSVSKNWSAKIQSFSLPSKSFMIFKTSLIHYVMNRLLLV